MAETTAAVSLPAVMLPAPPPICSGTASLFLDLDGTLTPIKARPELVALSDNMLSLLRRVSKMLGGRLAIVSGRTVDDIYQLTGGTVGVIAGVHGLERRIGASTIRAEAAPGLGAAAAKLAEFAARSPGVLVENKVVSATLHYRQAPELEAEARSLAVALAAEHGLVLQTGKMVFELRTPGADKAGAVRTFMGDRLFSGSHPWFVGDDDTDEVGFKAAQALGGAGVLVGDERSTAARYRLPDVEAVEAWIATALCTEEQA